MSEMKQLMTEEVLEVASDLTEIFTKFCCIVLTSHLSPVTFSVKSTLFSNAP